MSRRSNLAYKYDPEPEPVQRRMNTAATTPAAEASAVALPDGSPAKGIMIAAALGITAWGAIGAGILSLWRLIV